MYSYFYWYSFFKYIILTEGNKEKVMIVVFIYLSGEEKEI